jgi:hypothetical protein
MRDPRGYVAPCSTLFRFCHFVRTPKSKKLLFHRAGTAQTGPVP